MPAMMRTKKAKKIVKKIIGTPPNEIGIKTPSKECEEVKRDSTFNPGIVYSY